MRSFLKSDSGASAAEFALTLPLLLIFIFGIIDAGRLAWEFNRAEKATQVGVRVAVVTNSFPPGLTSWNFVDQTIGGVKLTQGDRIPAAALGDLKCTRGADCTCVSAPCPATPGQIDSATFDSALLPRMQAMYPKIAACNIELHYSGSGLGYAGDPNGMQIAPLVTVKLVETNTCPLKFTPITSLLLAAFSMPEFSSSLTAEDASGTASN